MGFEDVNVGDQVAVVSNFDKGRRRGFTSLIRSFRNRGPSPTSLVSLPSMIAILLKNEAEYVDLRTFEEIRHFVALCTNALPSIPSKTELVGP